MEPFVTHSNGPTRPPKRRYKSRRQRGLARAFVVREKTGDERALVRLRVLDTATEGELEAIDEQRPRTRADCRDLPRPCPWVSCKHHLYLDVIQSTGSLKINFPDLEPWELAETCALDVAERGGITLDQVGELTNVTRERIRQIETRGLLTLKATAPEHGIDEESVAEFPHPEGNQHPDAAAYSTARDESIKRARDAYRDRQRAAELPTPTDPPKED